MNRNSRKLLVGIFLLICIMPSFVFAGMINSPSLGELIGMLVLELIYPFLLEVVLFVALVSYAVSVRSKKDDEASKKQLKKEERQLVFLVFLAIISYPVCMGLLFMKCVYFIEVGISFILLIYNSIKTSKEEKKDKQNKKNISKKALLLIILGILMFISFFVSIAITITQ